LMTRAISRLKLASTVSFNDFGEEVETWATLTQAWAKRKDASAAEQSRAREVGAQITARFTIRWNSTVADVNPRDRIVFDGAVYDITAARDVGRREWRELDAVARADIAAESA